VSTGLVKPGSKPLRVPSPSKPTQDIEPDASKIIARINTPTKDDESDILKEFMERKKEVETITSKQSSPPPQGKRLRGPGEGKYKSPTAPSFTSQRGPSKDVSYSMELDIEQEIVEEGVKLDMEKPNVLKNKQWVDLDKQPTILSTDRLEMKPNSASTGDVKRVLTERGPSITFLNAEVNKERTSFSRTDLKELESKGHDLTPKSILSQSPTSTKQDVSKENISKEEPLATPQPQNSPVHSTLVTTPKHVEDPEETIPPISATPIPDTKSTSSPNSSGDIQEDVEEVSMEPKNMVAPQTVPKAPDERVENPFIPSDVFT
jgi:hypothetical protein